MESFLRLLAFGAAAGCLGVAVTIAAIFALATRDSEAAASEGCLGRLVTGAILIAAVFFFYLAVAAG